MAKFNIADYLDDFLNSVQPVRAWFNAVDWQSLKFGFIAIFCALGLWFFWLYYGASFTKDILISSGNQISTLTPEADIVNSLSSTSTPSVTYDLSFPLPTKADSSVKSTSSEPFSAKIQITLQSPPFQVPPSSSSTRLSELGQSGDSFGGANALFASIAGGLLAWAGWLQRKALLEARMVDRRQTFEATFFKLLTLTRELESRFNRSPHRSNPRPKPVRQVRRRVRSNFTGQTLLTGVSTYSTQSEGASQGTEALSVWAQILIETVERYRGAREDKEVLLLFTTYFEDHIFKRNAGMFGPYFRTLYQTFKLIYESNIEESEKTRYAKIARGLINEDAIFLLAVNALGPHGKKFQKYIKKYSLLEHMNYLHKRKYLQIFREGFSGGSLYEENNFQSGKAKSPDFNFYNPRLAPQLKDSELM